MATPHWNGWIPPDPRPADPHAEPIYGCQPFARAVLVDGREAVPPCPHHGPIPKGSVDYCERCAAYGRDYDKRLVIDERERPKPEPVVAIEADPEPTRAEERTGKPTSGKMAKRRAKRKAVEAQAA